MLELEILYERKRIRYSASKIASDLASQIGLTVCQLPMAGVMQGALELKWTRSQEIASSLQTRWPTAMHRS